MRQGIKVEIIGEQQSPGFECRHFVLCVSYGQLFPGSSDLFMWIIAFNRSLSVSLIWHQQTSLKNTYKGNACISFVFLSSTIAFVRPSINPTNISWKRFIYFFYSLCVYQSNLQVFLAIMGLHNSLCFLDISMIVFLIWTFTVWYRYEIITSLVIRHFLFQLGDLFILFDYVWELFDTKAFSHNLKS